RNFRYPRRGVEARARGAALQARIAPMFAPNGPLDAAAIKLHRKGSGPSLVLVHCLGVDRRLWDIATAGLQADFTLVNYDLPGHGATPVPDNPYRVEDLSLQLASALD